MKPLLFTVGFCGLLMLQACDSLTQLGASEKRKFLINGNGGVHNASLEVYYNQGTQEAAIAAPPTQSTRVAATIYYIPNETKFGGSTRTMRIRNADGKMVSVSVKESFYQAIKIQGSGILNDGRTITIYGKGGWQFTDKRYGLGTAQKPLIPFRSVAIDHEQFPNLNNGDKIFIPSTRGMKIPGTTLVHDGYWIVSDVGLAIKGKHIDMFVGDMHYYEFMRYVNDPKNFVESGTANISDRPKLGSDKQSQSIQIYI